MPRLTAIARAFLLSCAACLALHGWTHAATTDEATCPSGAGRPYTLLVADEVYATGVIPIARSPHPADEPLVATIVVRDAAGTPVDGTLVVVSRAITVFRPDETLVIGETYEVALGQQDAPLFDPRHGATTAAAEWAVVATAGQPQALAPQQVISELEYAVAEQPTAGGLVCCDGAYPVLSGHGSSVCFDGLCGSTVGVGVHAFRLTVDEGAPLAAAANSYVRRVDVPREVDDQLCYTVRIEDLTAGAEASTFERCHARPAGELGPVEHDPVPALIEACEGDPYICESHESDQGWAWDPAQCRSVEASPENTGPWSDDGGGDVEEDAPGAGAPLDAGCGCTGGGGPWPSALVWPFIVLGLFRRRS